MDPEEQLRNEAWIGDAVLALFARSWLLRIGPARNSKDRNQLFELWVSNQFLSSFGDPTGVEAEIGRIYATGGLDAAFTFIEERFLDRFVQAARKRGFNLTVVGRKTRRAETFALPKSLPTVLPAPQREGHRRTRSDH